MAIESRAAGVGYEKLNVAGTAVPITTIPDSTREVIIGVEGNDVRLRNDGTAPTATDGLLLPAGTIVAFSDYTKVSLEKFQFIATGAAATITIMLIET